jgi:hypothetical protein
MRNPYAAPEPRNSNTVWWLLLVVVAVLTLVLVVSLGKDRTPGTHLGYSAGSLERGWTPLPR